MNKRRAVANANAIAMAAFAAAIPVLLPNSVAAAPLASYAWTGTIYDNYTVDPPTGPVAIGGDVTFTLLSSGDLEIVLRNLATQSPTSTKQILTGSLFDIGGFSSALTMEAATANQGIVNAGSTTPTDAGKNICADGSPSLPDSCAAGNLLGGWQAGFSSAGVSATFPQKYGIGTSGAGGFQGSKVGDANYGLAPAIGVTTLDGLTGMQPYTFVQATFLLSGSGLTTSNTILNIQPIYGTTLDDIQPPNDVPSSAVPEPTSMLLLGSGLIGLGAFVKKRTRG